MPEETCNLEPQRSCKQVTKLVPLLKAGEECVDIPKEVCSRYQEQTKIINIANLINTKLMDIFEWYLALKRKQIP